MIFLEIKDPQKSNQTRRNKFLFVPEREGGLGKVKGKLTIFEKVSFCAFFVYDLF